MNRNRNFMTNIYYSLFPDRVKITYLDTPNKVTIQNTHYEIIRSTLTVGTYLTLFLFTHNPHHIINILCEFM